MPRTSRSHTPAGETMSVETTPKHLRKQDFGRRLYQHMIAKGWRQSELARQADIKRDSVSTYIRGKTLPTPLNLRKLAKALGVTDEDLLPNYMESAIDEDMPAFEMRVSPGAPTKAWVRVNRMVSTSTAVKLAELLEEDELTNRK